MNFSCIRKSCFPYGMIFHGLELIFQSHDFYINKNHSVRKTGYSNAAEIRYKSLSLEAPTTDLMTCIFEAHSVCLSSQRGSFQSKSKKNTTREGSSSVCLLNQLVFRIPRGTYSSYVNRCVCVSVHVCVCGGGGGGGGDNSYPYNERPGNVTKNGLYTYPNTVTQQ